MFCTKPRISRVTSETVKLLGPCGPAGQGRAADERPQRTPRDQRELPQLASRAPRELRYERGQFGCRGLMPVAPGVSPTNFRVGRAGDRDDRTDRKGGSLAGGPRCPAVQREDPLTCLPSDQGLGLIEDGLLNRQPPVRGAGGVQSKNRRHGVLRFRCCRRPCPPAWRTPKSKRPQFMAVRARFELERGQRLLDSDRRPIA